MPTNSQKANYKNSTISCHRKITRKVKNVSKLITNITCKPKPNLSGESIKALQIVNRDGTYTEHTNTTADGNLPPKRSCDVLSSRLNKPKSLELRFGTRRPTVSHSL